MNRAKGSGSVFPLCSEKHGCPPKIDGERPDHKCKAPWRGQIEAGYTASGARRYVTVTGRSEKDATTKLRARQNQIEQHGIPKAGAATVTVKRWAEEWLTIYQRRVSPNRWTDARGVVRRYIIPAIGHKRLSSLTPADVRDVHAAVSAAGFSLHTSLRAHDVLMVMIKDAGREGYRVPGNTLTVKRPGVPESERDALPIDDAVALLRTAMTMPDGSKWVAPFLQGMRRGECLGLTWDRVDFDRRLVDVSWQLQALPYEDREAGTFRVPDGYRHKQLVGQMHLVRPKTRKSKRVLPIVPWMWGALDAWKQIAPPNRWGLVWTDNGEPIRMHDHLDAWVALQDAAQVAFCEDGEGRRYTLHEARHTCATILLQQGVDPHVVTSILGHSKITTSRGYQHVSLDMEMDALEQVASRLQLGLGITKAPPPSR